MFGLATNVHTPVYLELGTAKVLPNSTRSVHDVTPETEKSSVEKGVSRSGDLALDAVLDTAN